jgi:hypothetical protein
MKITHRQLKRLIREAMLVGEQPGAEDHLDDHVETEEEKAWGEEFAAASDAWASRNDLRHKPTAEEDVLGFESY